MYVLDYPEDPNVRNVDDEYLFCDTFLVAPMFSDRGGRRVYLPAGLWWRFPAGNRVDIHGERVESRGEWVTVGCELDELPVWVRDGSVVLRCGPGEYVDAAAMIATLSVQCFGAVRQSVRDVVLPDGSTARLSFESDGRVATLHSGPIDRTLAVLPPGGD